MQVKTDVGVHRTFVTASFNVPVTLVLATSVSDLFILYKSCYVPVILIYLD